MLRKAVVGFIAVVPFTALRVFLYRALLGYEIAPGGRIGMFNFINAGRLKMGRAAIGSFNLIDVGELVMDDGAAVSRFNRFKMFNRLQMGERSVIRSNNTVFGTLPGISPFKGHEDMALGKDCIITNGHLFDLSDSVTFGDNVTVAGKESQFWTHSFDFGHVKMQAPIAVDDDVYIGARSIITPGVNITSRVSVGAGTTVSKSITEPGFYVSSSLVRKGDVPDYSAQGCVERNGARFCRRKDRRDAEGGV